MSKNIEIGNRNDLIRRYRMFWILDFGFFVDSRVNSLLREMNVLEMSTQIN